MYISKYIVRYRYNTWCISRSHTCIDFQHLNILNGIPKTWPSHGQIG